MAEYLFLTDAPNDMKLSYEQKLIACSDDPITTPS
jgi:hypothetical protein